MRSLHADLSAAQEATKRRPYLYAQVRDELAGLNRLRRSQWYSGAEPDGGHAAVVAADGSLIRCRFSGTTLYRSRVTSPTSGSDYSSWTVWSASYKANLVALCKAGSTLWCFVALNATQTQVWASTSADHGASWSAFSLRFTNSAAVDHIAAAGKSDGHVVVLVNSGSGQTQTRAWRWNTSTWTDHGASGSGTGLTALGIAIFHSGDWNVTVTGADASGDHHVRRLIFGDGYSAAANTWSTSIVNIVSAISTSNIQYSRPYAARPDTNRVTIRHAHTGTVAYDRVAHTHQPALGSFVDDLWREPVPAAIVAAYGLAISYDSTNIFLTTARYVFHSPVAVATLDLTDDIAEADINEKPLNPLRSHLLLDNSSGKYDTPGAGAVAALTKGADVHIGQGYLTASGARYSLGPTYHVEAFEHIYEKGRATLRVILGSPWTHLARHRFPRALALPESDKNIFTQLSYVAARVGYEFTSTGGSSQSDNLYPPLVIQPGTSALTAFRALMDRLPDHVISRGRFFFLNEPLAADTADAAYQRPLTTGDQHIAAATYRSALKESNHVQVFAEEDASIIAEDLDDAEAQLLYSAPRQRADPYLYAGSQATARAANEQRHQVIAATQDQITAPVHCGIETNDVIAVTDARAGLSAAKRRVLAIRTTYRRGPRTAAYDHTLTLGAA